MIEKSFRSCYFIREAIVTLHEGASHRVVRGYPFVFLENRRLVFDEDIYRRLVLVVQLYGRKRFYIVDAADG